MNLKEFYLNAENKYYDILEKIDQTVPITKLTDAIDRYVPSFIVFIALIAIIVIAAGLILAGVPLLPGAASHVTISVKDDLDNPVADAMVQLTFLGEERVLSTNEAGEVTIDIPLGVTVRVEVSKAGFEPAVKPFDAIEATMRFPVTLISIASITRKRITLTYPDSSLFDEEATVSFACSNLGITAPDTVTTSTGLVEVSPDPNCGNLLVQVMSREYKTLSARSISGQADSSTIYLSAFEVGKGSVEVFVEDAQGEKIDDIDVELYTNLGVIKGSQRTYNGQAKFTEVSVGEYYISARDPRGEYALKESSRKSVQRNKSTAFTIVLSKSVKGTISVNVADKRTQQALANATVKLQKSLTEPPIATLSTKASADTVTFSITEIMPYYVLAYHDDYLAAWERVESISDNPTVDLELEVLTPENSGAVVAKVRDEKGKLVEGAQVFIYDATTDWLHPIDPKITDANGEAKFKGVKSGTYYLKAIKGLAEADSDQQAIDIRQPSYFPITLTRGTATFNVNVVDAEGTAVPTARVEFNPLGEGEAVAILTDVKGVAGRLMTANQRAYVRVSKEGYSSWTSQVVILNPDEVVELTAELETTIPGEKPLIAFLGLFESDDSPTPVTEVKAGLSYIARMQVKIPEEGDYTELGVHIRTGGTELMDKDNLYIKDVWAADAIVVRGTSFNPPTGWNTDQGNLAYGDAKWANLLFKDLRKGVYNVSAEVRVKKQIVPGDAAPIYYRVWAEHKDSRILRAPEDAELGEARQTGAKDELYAKANEKIFWEGQPALCDDSFCYSGERILDTEERLYKTVPYTVSLFGKHKLFFDITNNSDAVHDKAEIRIKNAETGKLVGSSLEINSYKIVNADAQEFSRGNLAIFKMDPIVLGRFVRNRSVTGEIDFTPKKIGVSDFELVVVSEGIEVFKKNITLTILADKEIAAEFSPEIVPAFIDNESFVEIEETETGLAIEDARVVVSRRLPNGNTLRLGTYHTDGTGRADFTLPAATPGSLFVIEVEKAGYASTAIEKRVEEEVVLFEPREFVSDLKVLGPTEEILNAKATNLLPFDLKISDVTITGYFKGYLDEIGMSNYAKQFKDYVLQPGLEQDVAILKTALNTGLETRFLPDAVEGTEHVIFRSDELGKSWPLSLDFTTAISIGEGVAEENCLIIENGNVPNWEAVSQGDTIATEFSIINRCVAGGRPVDLRDLRATIDWQGNAIGTVELAVMDLETGEGIQSVLRQGRWETFFDTISPEDTGVIYTGTLYFTPKGGHTGETANFEVTIDADVLTDAGPVAVGANTPINGTIYVINLSECIETTPEADIGIKLERGEDEKTFEIDTTKCGAVPLDIYLCFNDPNCRGGTDEGGISLEPQTITNLQGRKTVRIKRMSIPGIYGLTIYARPPGKSHYYAKTVNVLVEPESGKHYFTLDKYDFTVLGVGSEDATSLYNEQYVENVSVTATMCAWRRSGIEFNFAERSAIAGAAGLAAGALIIVAASASTGVGIVVGIAVAILVFVLLPMLEEDCHDDTETQSLMDYVINLSSGRSNVYEHTYQDEFWSSIGEFVPGGLSRELYDTSRTVEYEDYSEVIVSNDEIEGRLNTAESNVYADPDMGKSIQEVGMVFTNLGLEELAPTYAIVEVKADEHVHGDPAHAGNAEVTLGKYDCDGERDTSFNNCPAPFHVPDTDTTTYAQKFHLRFKTADVNRALQPLSYDVFDCSRGALSGRTGPGALPKIKLAWGWHDIEWDSCDAANPNAIYCDATQFSIMMTKRLEKFRQFLEENDYSFACPTHPYEEASAANNQNLTHTVPDSQLGLLRAVSDFDAGTNSAEITATVENKTATAQTASVLMQLSTFAADAADDTIIDTCSIDDFNIGAGDTNTADCSFNNLEQGNYYVVVSLSSSTTSDLNDWQPIVPIIVAGEALGESDECWQFRTTQKLGGTPVISDFMGACLEEDGCEIRPGGGISGGQAAIGELEHLLNFDAYLIKDSYSTDFRQDFVRHFENELAGSQTFFHNPASQKDQFIDYFLDSDRMVFRRKYIPYLYDLPAPGRYKVNLNGLFGDEWKFYDNGGQPNALFAIMLYHFKDPIHGSPFYSMPFDGLVGLEGSSFNRQGYGTAFENLAGEIKLNSTIDSPKTSESPGSNAMMSVTTDIDEDFRKLNSLSSTRGNVLSVRRGFSPTEKRLVYSPSLPTPVILKTTHTLDNEPFSTYYSVAVDGTAVETGSTMSYWDGCGSCFDFTGVPVYEAFDYKPDRGATSHDNVPYWETAYAVDWPMAVKSGDVFLRSIFYTPRNKQTSLQLIQPLDRALFYTSTEVGQSPLLEGTSGIEAIDSLQDVFELVKTKKVCVTSTGIISRFWWNPAEIYKQSGGVTIEGLTTVPNTFCEAVGAAEQCITAAT